MIKIKLMFYFPQRSHALRSLDSAETKKKNYWLKREKLSFKTVFKQRVKWQAASDKIPKAIRVICPHLPEFY